MGVARSVAAGRAGAAGVAVALVVALGGLGVSSCAAPTVQSPGLTPGAQSARVDGDSSAVRSAASPSTFEYVPSVSELRASGALVPSTAEPDGGVLVDGWRLTVDARRYSREVADPPLRGGVRVPRRLGGGFLFWNGRGLYHARSFLGTLEPLWSLPHAVADVRFGRDLALIRLADQARVALGLPAMQPVPLPVAGLVDLAVLDDGRAVMVTEPDRTAVSPAGAAGWRDVSGQVGTPGQLVATEREIWLESEGGRGMRVEPDGSLTEFDRVPPALKRRPAEVLDPRWPLDGESPIERAVRRGVPIDAGEALVEAGGAVARVRIPNGELVSVSRRTLPAEASCELLPVAEEVIALCTTASASFVTRGLLGTKEPEVDRTFVGRARFVAGADGALGFDGPCSGSPQASATICVRAANGRWRDVSLTDPSRSGGSDIEPGDDAASGDAATRERDRVRRWVPRSDGSVVVIYGGEQPGWWDSRARGQVDWPPDRAVSTLAAIEWGSGTQQVVVDELAVAADGALVGYVRRQPVRVESDGTLAPTPWDMTALASAGRRALARSADGRLWQSSDYGAHWNEVAAPPGCSNAAPVPAACSRVGCDLNRWYRLGYPTSAPEPLAVAEAPPPPRWPTAALPRLECVVDRPPTLTVARRLLDREGSPVDELDLGAHTIATTADGGPSLVGSTFAGDDDAVRVTMEIEPVLGDVSAPEAGAALGRSRTIRSYDPLSARPVVGSARFTWRDLVRATAPLGYPDLGLMQGDGGMLFPMLEERPGAFAGLLLVDTGASVAFDVRDRQPPRTLAVGALLEEHDVGGALRLSADEIALLMHGDGCGLRAMAWSSSGGRVVLEVPDRGGDLPCPLESDALALAVDGRLGVIRLPSGPLVPTQDDPAMLLVPGQPPTALAPWSTLVAANDPGCAAPDGGARVLLSIARRWLELAVPGHLPGAEPSDAMLAQLRWGTRRICLEAVELPADVVPFPDGEVPTAVVARFAPKVEAIRRGYALGAELHQPLRCVLRPPS